MKMYFSQIIPLKRCEWCREVMGVSVHISKDATKVE
jgi:hypothetical protein